MPATASPASLKWANKTDREFDITIFGASGFTGRFVLEEALLMARLGSDAPGAPPWPAPLRIAAAGRSRVRVERALAEAQAAADKAAEEMGGRQDVAAGAAGVVDASIVVADVCDSASLAAMARRSCVVINCVGPFRFHGAPVVDACVLSGSDYVDICGEPEFMERMAFNCHAQAMDTGALVVSGCGFDSVPADLGTQYALRALPPSLSCAVSVASYLSVSAECGLAGHYATWESLVHGLAGASSLGALRRAAAATAAAAEQHASGDPSSSAASSQPSRAPLPSVLRAPSGPPPSGWSSLLARLFPLWPRWESSVSAWVLPFPGADASVVRRAIRSFQEQQARRQREGAEGKGKQAEQRREGGGANAGGGGDGDRDNMTESETAAFLSSAGPMFVAPVSAASASFPVPTNSGGSIKYSAYFTLSSSLHVLMFLGFGAVLKLLSSFPLGIRLLLQYPRFFSCGVFSHEGPSPPQLSSTRFRMLFHARGFSAQTVKRFEEQGRGEGGGRARRIRPIPDSHVSCVVNGPEMGYVATPRIAVQCALYLLRRTNQHLPAGGVVTPAVAFGGGDALWGPLSARGVEFKKIRG